MFPQCPDELCKPTRRFITSGERAEEDSRIDFLSAYDHQSSRRERIAQLGTANNGWTQETILGEQPINVSQEFEKIKVRR